MEFDSKRPIYLQIMETIKTPVLRGELALGSSLLSVREQAKKMGVNHNTMARAYTELEREGFIVTRRGLSATLTTDCDLIQEQRKQLLDAIVSKFKNEIESIALTDDEIATLVVDITDILRREYPPTKIGKNI